MNDESQSVGVCLAARAEWAVVLSAFPNAKLGISPWGKWFQTTLAGQPTVFLHGGWGKIAAAGSSQYLIDRWSPKLLINIGTCGGFENETEIGEILLAQKTVVYDIIERMTDQAAAISSFTTEIDLSWLKEPLPLLVRKTTLVSADRDLRPKDIPNLHLRYGAVAADWESGAIALVCGKNKTPCLILRAVTDLVNLQGGEADNNYTLFAERTARAMPVLLQSLPEWIECASVSTGGSTDPDP